MNASRHHLSNLGRGLLLAAAFALTGTVQAQQPYKVGAILCSSGPFASVGIDELRGAQLAEKSINAAGGIGGRKLQLIAEDDQGRADLGVIRANKLVNQDKVSAIIACFGAGVTAYSDLLRKSETPLFGFISSASITEIGNPYIFRTALGDPTVIVGLAGMLQKQGKKRVALLYQGDTSGKGMGILATKNAASHGYQIVADESFPVQANLDLSPQLTRIRAANPDAVIIWAGAPQSAVALKNMQQLGMKVQAYGGVPMGTTTVLTTAGDAADGAIVPDVINHGKPNAMHVQFQEMFRKEYGSDPVSSYSMAAWDSIHMIAEALKGTNGEGGKVKSNAEKITNYKGLMGNYTYTVDNREGLTTGSIIWHRIQSGKLVVLQ